MSTVMIDDHYIVNWLISNPDFFIRQSPLLANLKLTSPYSHRAISLQERQLEILREKIRSLELRIAELLRYGHENDRILDNLHLWLITLLSQANLTPQFLSQSLCQAFDLPYAKLHLWTKTDSNSSLEVQHESEQASWTTGPLKRQHNLRSIVPENQHSGAGHDGVFSLHRFLDADVPARQYGEEPHNKSDKVAQLKWNWNESVWQQTIDKLIEPKCGRIDVDPLLLEMSTWLNNAQITSLALIPVRPFNTKTTTTRQPSIGLWILGAYDEQRFSAEMGTAYLAQIGALANATLQPEQYCEN